MAKIGNLGKLIVFEVNNDKVLTFSNMTQTVKGRWTTHAIIGEKPKSEFLGPDVRSASLEITVSAVLGVKPQQIIDTIEKAIEQGTPFPFVLGGKKIGSNQWVITEMSEAWETIIRGGKLMEAKLTITLAEYI